MSKSDICPDLCVNNTQPIIYPFKAVFTKITTLLLNYIIHKSGIQKRMCQITWKARHCFILWGAKTKAANMFTQLLMLFCSHTLWQQCEAPNIGSGGAFSSVNHQFHGAIPATILPAFVLVLCREQCPNPTNSSTSPPMKNAQQRPS